MFQVGYNIGNWLEKNKDPINENVVELLSHSTNHLVKDLFYTPPAEGSSTFIFSFTNCFNTCKPYNIFLLKRWFCLLYTQ